jgi:hypothetical protein
VANTTVRFTGQRPFQDFDSSTDVPDFPQYFYNALAWGLADQLCYQYGVGLSERAMINKKMAYHLTQAMLANPEEGSFRIMPNYG